MAKNVNLSVGRGEKLPVLMDGFTFVESENYYVGKENQIYCEHTKVGKQYIYAHFEEDTKKLFYIGLGKYNRCNQMNQRNKYWKFIKEKHGVIIKLLEVNLTLDKAKEREIFYIKKFEPRANMTIGGEAGNTENLRIRVYAYLKNGVSFNSFNSITDANVFFNTKENDSRINKCLKGERKSFAGYIWKTTYSEFIEPYKKSKPYNQKSVYRYDLNGNFIEKFDKILDFKEGSHTGICNVIDTDYTYKSSFWRSFKSNNINVQKKPNALKECVKVIDITTDVIYDSISQAAKANNIRPSNLQRKLQGKRRNNTNLRYYGK
jgi:hypothetical protein